ncbi:MAG: DNA-methyltransferase [Mycoplasma sp.]
MSEIKINNLYNENCVDFINQLKETDIKVDLLLTDPPYNISQKNNFKTIGRAGIDFGEWDKDFNLTTWIKDLDLITSKNATVIIFNAWKNLGVIASALEDAGFEIKDCLRWIKNNPMPRNVERRYVVDYELMVWAVKKKSKWTFNKPEDKSYLRPEFNCPLPGKRIHPTEKPIKLLEEIIKIHSNEGDLIYDPFSGSAAISVAALKNNRNFIATELDKEHFENSTERLKEIIKQYKGDKNGN